MADKGTTSDNKARSSEMATTTHESLDQPSDEAIAIAHIITKGPGPDEMNTFDPKNTNSDEEDDEDLEIDESELPSRDNIKPKKGKKKSKQTKSNTTQDKEQDVKK